jgi:serine/threonine protein kinase
MQLLLSGPSSIRVCPGGTMFDLIMKVGLSQEDDEKEIFRQIVAAIKYCHNLDIVDPDQKSFRIYSEIRMVT